MQSSLVVADPDFALSPSLADQLDRGGCSYSVIGDADAAAASISQAGQHLVGLITAIDLPGQQSGWDLARFARQSSPAAIVGYRADTTNADWLANGVPQSVLLSAPFEQSDVVPALLRACRDRHVAAGGAHYDPDDPIAVAATAEGAPTPVFNWSQTSLKRGQDSLQILFEKAPSFIAFLEGPDHRFTYANQAYLQVVDKPSVAGRTVLELFPEVVGQGFIDLLDTVYRTGEPYHAHDIPFYVQTSQGIKHTLLDLMYFPVREASGDISGIFVQGVDVTERHEAEHKIKALQNELIHVARVNALGTLVSALAHEINQPLTSIHNYMAAARVHAERMQLEGPITTCLKGTGEAALRAGDVIRRLREMASRRDLNREPLDLDVAVRETIALAAVGRFDSNVELGATAKATVLADKVQIQQVLLNLIQNAFEAGCPDPVQVTVSVADTGRDIEISVSDDGPGIAPDALPRIFDSFMTTKSHGMGVGLSICRTIVESHGGTLDARNNADGGACFYFTLPKAAST